MNISDYGFLSDSQSSALVSRDGSVDWYCTPRFDSPSVFARLLDRGAGHWSIRPAGEYTVERSYEGYSLVLRSVFRTPAGAVSLTDALMFEPGSREHDIGMRVPHVLLRSVRGLSGSVAVEMEFFPRFEYGLIDPEFTLANNGWDVSGGPTGLRLASSVSGACDSRGIRARFTLAEGQGATFSLSFTGACRGTEARAVDVDSALEDTAAGWHSWMDIHAGYQGLFREEVRRSAIVLQGLTYQPSGAVVAAATTSLPEIPGRDWNWDYRYAWLRDASMVMNALWVGACPDEPERFFSWIDRCGGGAGKQALQIMFGVEGERDLTEHFLEHLAGFENSRPVRVGNDAWKQKQLDVPGEVLDAACQFKEKLGGVEGRLRAFLISLAERAYAGWKDPDRGMWELRDRERHYLSSKLMCWVALDRAVKLAPGLSAHDGLTERWRKGSDEIRAAILGQGWSDRAGAYTGAFGSDTLDASVLLMPITGFLPAADPRMKATIEAVDRELGSDGLIRRFPGEPAGFVLCSYWMAQCLTLAGDVERAARRFESITARANDLLLLSEEIDPATSLMLGNFPQAFSHIGLINTAWELTNARA